MKILKKTNKQKYFFFRESPTSPWAQFRAKFSPKSPPSLTPAFSELEFWQRQNTQKRLCCCNLISTSYEPRHDKTNKVSVRPAKTQISLGIRPVLSESSLSAWRKIGSIATDWAHSEDSDRTGRMLIFFFVLSCRGSYDAQGVPDSY